MWETFQQIWRARAWDRRGQRLYQQGRFDEAIAAYEAALALRPAAPLTHHNLGLALYKAGRKAEARAHWQTMLALTEDAKPYLAEQARILLRQFG